MYQEHYEENICNVFFWTEQKLTLENILDAFFEQNRNW